MTSDLVERLRKLADRERPYGSLPDTLEEAAARIERLEAALRDLMRLVEEDPEEDDPSPYLFDQVCDRARAALEEK